MSENHDDACVLVRFDGVSFKRPLKLWTLIVTSLRGIGRMTTSVNEICDICITHQQYVRISHANGIIAGPRLELRVAVRDPKKENPCILGYFGTNVSTRGLPAGLA